MDKILAIVVLVLFVWLAIPRILQGEWLAPTASMPGSWNSVAEASANPPGGFGWFHFDFWNTPTANGQPFADTDTRLRPVSREFRR